MYVGVGVGGCGMHGGSWQRERGMLGVGKASHLRPILQTRNCGEPHGDWVLGCTGFVQDVVHGAVFRGYRPDILGDTPPA
ncbi:hypothetical protein ANK1_3401 [plant metagenome]|uniref:Uncharacterized protein n=1 Tax=plant metagenome TaxID=1297885 RepID=A0A484SR40_9ZZZZ